MQGRRTIGYNVLASRRGVPGFHLQDSGICLKEQNIVVRNIRHGEKHKLSVGSRIVKEFFWGNHCLLHDR
ncbi:MAG: hypothetical protein SGI96_12505, partial [Bacteroidota bacterium]|nr:hypothetical protein [Bacteroidota bacterium]